jgi:type II restriction enzyme
VVFEGLAAIDEDDGDLFVVLLAECGVGVDVDLAPLEGGLAVELDERVLDDITEVAALARVDDDVVHEAIVNAGVGLAGSVGYAGARGAKRVELACDLRLAEGYKSASQRARVLSEDWFAKNAYCLACDADEVEQTKANTGATDFVCPKCSHRYELKTFERRPSGSLVDGAYESMMQRIRAGTAPTLCLMERTKGWKIRTLTAVHSSFLVPLVIEKRPPLAPTARRAGWVGCNIRLDQIASDGEVDVVDDGLPRPVDEVRRRFQRFLPLAKKRAEQRGWTLLTLRLVRGLGKTAFRLDDMYALEDEFARVYPENHHVRDKIRQQLQVLRDLGVLEFVGRGEYRIYD